jgi:signal transduction histidine kinase
MERALPNFSHVRDAESFAAQLNEFAQRVWGLRRAGLQTQFSPELLEQSLAELCNAVEELQVAQDEITRQRDDLRDAQGELEHQRQRYKELFDYAPTSYLVTNLVGTIADANDAAAVLLQVRREFLLGSSLLTFVESSGRPAFRDALAAFTSAQVANAPRAWEASMLRRRRTGGSLSTDGAATDGAARDGAARDGAAADGGSADGKPADGEAAPGGRRDFDAELIVSRMHTLLNEPDKLLWLVRDVTAHHESQRRARQSERLAALGEMVATFAHESGNALQRSQAALEMLANRVTDRPDAVELLAEVQSAHDHLAHLQKQIKDYASPLRIERLPCHLGSALQRAWQSLHLAKARQQVRLEEQNEASSLCCSADFTAAQQVFRNVLENSLAACRDPARILVRYRDAALNGLPALEIRVQDNGPGIAAAVRQRIFEPFFTTRVKGMGLGMAIVKRIVEAHGGEVGIDEADEPGTCVTIILPRGET